MLPAPVAPAICGCLRRLMHGTIHVTVWWLNAIPSLEMKFRVKLWLDNTTDRGRMPRAAGCQRAFWNASGSAESLGTVPREPQLILQAHVSNLCNSDSELSYCAKKGTYKLSTSPNDFTHQKKKRQWRFPFAQGGFAQNSINTEAYLRFPIFSKIDSLHLYRK